MNEPVQPASIRGLILSVGVTPDPVIYSIRESDPEYLGLIGTPQSRGTMDRVFEQIAFPPHKVRTVTVDDSPECIGELVERTYELFQWMREELGLRPEEIAADPTPGRKWMSAGATIAASHLGLPMFYVDVQFVDKKPDPSTMRLVQLGNAFDQTGFFLADRGRFLFNRGQFAAAAEAYREIRPLRSRDADWFAGMAALAEALHRWDLFEHYETSLRPAFDDAMTRLERYLVGEPSSSAAATFVDRVRTLAEQIEMVARSPQPSLAAVVDLVLNARRRIACGQYDDGVARLYRAFEALAQYYLRADFDIDVSDPKWDSKPPHIRESVERACGELPELIACVAGWNILRELQHRVAVRLFMPKKKGQWQFRFEGLLNDRNQSILAHGWRPIERQRAETMLARVEQLLSGEEAELWSELAPRLMPPELPPLRGTARDGPN